MKYSEVKNWDKKELYEKYQGTKKINVNFCEPLKG